VPIDDALDYLGGISKSFLYGLIRNGEIRTVALGRRRMIDRVELDRYINERSEASL
jgi:excisionase family DNA binding protein